MISMATKTTAHRKKPDLLNDLEPEDTAVVLDVVVPVEAADDDDWLAVAPVD